MAEKTTTRKKTFNKRVPEETREHYRQAREEMRKSFEGLFPPEFAEHRREARKHMLLAWRSMIDSALEHMDEKAKQS